MLGLVKSHLTLQLLPTLLLLPPHLQGSFCPPLGETALSNITCNFPVQRAAAHSLNAPATFPALTSAHILPSPCNTLPTVPPSNPTLVYRPASHSISSRRPPLVLPTRCALCFFDHPQPFSSALLRTHLTSAPPPFFFKSLLALYFLISFTSDCFLLLGNTRSSAWH